MSIVPPRAVSASATAASGVQASASSRPAADIATKPGPYVQFEAFVLQSFIQAIMPQNATQVFGEGTAGEVWKSMLAEKIALQVAQSGGVGIAKMIAPKDGGPVSAPGGAPTAQAAAAGRLLDLQISSAQSAAAALAPTKLSAD